MPTVYFDYKLVDLDESVQWIGKCRVNNKLYKSKFCKNINLAIENLIYLIKNDKDIFYINPRLSKSKSYVIYKYYDGNKIIDKKKVVFQLTEEQINVFMKKYIIKCKDFVRKFKYEPVSEYDLLKNIEEKQKLYLKNNFSKNVVSKSKSWIKIYLEVHIYSNIDAEDEFSEALCDV